MTVIVAENTPDKVRGLLKRWFLEPKPNVFVGTVNRRTREKVLAYILKYAPEDLALLVISDDGSSQGFSVMHVREPAKRAIKMSGLYLVEKPPSNESALPETTSPGAAATDCIEASEVSGIADMPTTAIPEVEPRNESAAPPESAGIPMPKVKMLEADQIISQSLICYQLKK